MTRGGTTTIVGGLVAAFFASICCIGPVVFAALGVGIGATGFLAGTAGFLKALLPYRPVFIGLTMLLLGLSFYQAYRQPKSVCVLGEVCTPGAMSRENRTVLWALAVLALVLILAPYWLGL
ncbi:mercuric transporter MerT family protein [Nitrospira sp. CMX1]